MKTSLCKLVISLAVVLIMLCSVTAYAALERVGPNTGNGYPAWYQDKSGLVLEFGAPLNQAELDGGWCLILSADVPSGTAPETFPTNFAEEHFYWAGDANVDFTLPGGATSRARLVLGLEAAFSVGPAIPGDQVTFGRIRVDIKALPYDGTYTVYTPYNVWTFPDQVAGARLFFTEDIGINAAPGTFDAALLSNLGPFLLPANTPGGPELAPIPGPVPGKLYIADPARIGPVTGSLLAPFTSALDGVTRDHNIFRVEGPNGFVLETTDFALMGRIFTGTISGKVTVDRATYTRTATSLKTDVFVTAFAATQGRIPGQTMPPTVAPTLSFFNALPDVDPVTGALIAPAGQAKIQMFSAGKFYWGQSQPVAIPLGVTVQDETARDANGQIVPVFFGASLTDEIAITEAVYDPANGGVLSVKAVSSEQVTLPTLTLGGFGALVNGQILVTPLSAPPAKINVLSSIGGLNEMQVTTLLGSLSGGSFPIALNDNAVINEDTSITIDVLANDTLDGSPIPAGSGIVTIVGAPRLGTATLNADGSIGYTPNLNASGTEGISYTFTVNGIVSSAANVTITINPINDAPIAVNDSTSTVVQLPLAINVLGNDTDVDGQADLSSAVIVTQPQAGASVTGGPVVNFIATAAGIYTFTYRAQDAGGVLSANAATVSVTVTASEIIAVQQSFFRRIAARWIVSGTDSVHANQTLTIAYQNGVFADRTSAAGTVIGTATVDATGAWLLDIRSVTGVLNLNNRALFRLLPSRLIVSSPLGGSRVAVILVRN